VLVTTRGVDHSDSDPVKVQGDGRVAFLRCRHSQLEEGLTRSYRFVEALSSHSLWLKGLRVLPLGCIIRGDRVDCLTMRRRATNGWCRGTSAAYCAQRAVVLMDLFLQGLHLQRLSVVSAEESSWRVDSRERDAPVHSPWPIQLDAERKQMSPL
jgi:hypothetical protein